MNKSSLITGTLLIAAFLLPAINTDGQERQVSKEEIIKKTWYSMFGEMHPDDVKSIYLESYFHGSDVPNRVYVSRPNLFRNETGDIILVFDGKRAAMIKKTNGDVGNPEMVDSVYWAHFEVDIAIIFPAFFDYPSEYKGINRDNENEAYEIFVDLPLGGNITYFIDTDSYLVTRRLVSWEGDPGQELWENTVTGYNDYDGILFEKGYSFLGRNGIENGVYRNVRFNIATGNNYFEIASR